MPGRLATVAQAAQAKYEFRSSSSPASRMYCAGRPGAGVEPEKYYAHSAFCVSQAAASAGENRSVPEPGS